MDMQNLVRELEQLKVIVSRLAQMGTVCDIDTERRRARVTYDNSGMVSDWLCVQQHYKAEIVVTPDGAHSHSSGCGGTAGIPNHAHPGTHLAYWMPAIGDRVWVQHLPIEGGMGIIIGGI